MRSTNARYLLTYLLSLTHSDLSRPVHPLVSETGYYICIRKQDTLYPEILTRPIVHMVAFVNLILKKMVVVVAVETGDFVAGLAGFKEPLRGRSGKKKTEEKGRRE